ncbi:MAG: hypothetical protein GWO79_00585 [Actinobacteria bacterium]|nr:hypothetical protein [Actinomycetota bacterium]
MHLKISGYKITVGQLGKKEIDFVAEKGGKRIYIQAAYLIANDAIKEREFGNLLEIRDNYPKIVVSMDEVAEGQYKGVKHINIIDFLSREL